MPLKKWVAKYKAFREKCLLRSRHNAYNIVIHIDKWYYILKLT